MKKKVYITLCPSIIDNHSQIFASLAMAYYKEGLIKRDLGDHEKSERTLKEALVYCQKALDLNPYSVLAYRVSGQVHQALGNADKARQDFEKVIEIAEPSCMHSSQLLSFIIKPP